jgi:hypothetical protein
MAIVCLIINGGIADTDLKKIEEFMPQLVIRICGPATPCTLLKVAGNRTATSLEIQVFIVDDGPRSLSSFGAQARVKELLTSLPTTAKVTLRVFQEPSIFFSS